MNRFIIAQGKRGPSQNKGVFQIMYRSRSEYILVLYAIPTYYVQRLLQLG